jgi:hypothetical protein
MEKIHVYSILMGRLKERDHLVDLGIDGKMLFRMDDKYSGWGGADWVLLGQDRDHGGLL